MPGKKRVREGTLMEALIPELSIITSLFQADEYIEGFLENFEMQAGYEDAEHIFLSVYYSHKDPERMHSLIMEHIKKHPKSKYIIVHKDPGLYELWNLGIQVSNAVFVTSANVDDRNAPSYLEKHLSYLRERPDVDLVCSIVKVTKRKNESWYKNKARKEWYKKKKISVKKDEDFKRELENLNIIKNGLGSFEELRENKKGKIEILRNTKRRERRSIYTLYTEFSFVDMFVDFEDNGEIISYNIPHCSPVWRKSLHERFGFFDEANYGPYADFEFWLRCSARGAVFNFIQEPLVLYLENPNSHNRRMADDVIFRKLLEKYFIELVYG